MKINPCKPYHARTVERRRFAADDGMSVFKFYYISIIGRDKPGLYEWRGGADMDDFAARFAGSALEGVGFVTAFPHITKVFRFAPAMETVMHVRAFKTADLSGLPLERDDQYLEFACYAEAMIAADEYRAWAEADAVGQYLDFWSSFTDAPVQSNSKLAEYWQSFIEEKR